MRCRVNFSLLGMLAGILVAALAVYLVAQSSLQQSHAQENNDFDRSLRLGYTRWLSDTILNDRLDRAKSAGTTMVLVPVGWDQLEPSQDDGYS